MAGQFPGIPDSLPSRPVDEETPPTIPLQAGRSLARDQRPIIFSGIIHEIPNIIFFHAPERFHNTGAGAVQDDIPVSTG